MTMGVVEPEPFQVHLCIGREKWEIYSIILGKKKYVLSYVPVV